MQNRTKRVTSRDILILLLVAFLFVLPQMVNRSMIVGSDAIFHYNRFYDTAMQLKQGNFQYFISLYGFQQTGRIVNALYGPLMAYLQGILVLLSPSWFFYQIASNFILYCLSGLSFYVLLRKANIHTNFILYIPVLFMTTFSIQYWIMRQGFSSWGAALLPLCLLPIIDMAQEKKINISQLGVLTALMFQTHVFSTLMLIVCYVPFFLYAFFKSNTKKIVLRDLCLAIGLFGILTLNIWASCITVYVENRIQAPFVNHAIYQSTVDAKGRYWLLTPRVLTGLILLQVFFTSKFWSKFSILLKITLLTSFGLFFLSTSIFPWEYFSQQDMALVNLIQFPFRFFMPATVLFLLGLTLTMQNHILPTIRAKRVYEWFVQLAILISIFQALTAQYAVLEKWHAESWPIRESLHTFIRSTDKAEVKQAFFSRDLSAALQLVEKSTPDYLPIYGNDKKNKYRYYEQLILEQNDLFKKTVQQHTLVVEWESQNEKPINLPVIAYQNTNLVLNEQQLSNDQLLLSAIGTPTIQPRSGTNKMIVSYKTSSFFLIVLVIPMFGWLICLGLTCKKILFKPHNKSVSSTK